MDMVNALTAQVTQSQEHIGQLSRELDNAKMELLKLRKESSDAVAELRRQMATARSVDQPKVMNLVDKRHFAPEKFKGDKGENFKDWSKVIKNLLNSQYDGFRDALNLVETEVTKIDDETIELMPWEYAKEGNVKLYDFLVLVTRGDAQNIVEARAGEGYEAWRQLTKRYNPKGGRFELRRMRNLTHRKQCKNLNEVPAAVDTLLKEIKFFEAQSEAKVPEEWKMPMLLDILPDQLQTEMEIKFSLGERDFQKMMENVVSYANEHRVLDSRGRADMDVDTMNYQEPMYTAVQWQRWSDETYGDGKGQGEYQDIDYMGKGKGKFGGKYGGKKGKGKGKGNGGKPSGAGGKNNTNAIVCWWCDKPGHRKTECRRFLANKPKIVPGSAASLDEQNNDWEEDEVGYFERCCDQEAHAVDVEEDDSESESGDWSDLEENETPCTPEQDNVGTALFTPSPKTFKMDTPDSTTSLESLSERILREQRELKEKVLTTVLTKPPGLKDEESEEIKGKSSEEIKDKSENEVDEEIKNDEVEDSTSNPTNMTSSLVISASSKRNRNKSAKKKRKEMEILHECDVQSKVPREVEVQTEVHLPHTCRDVLWTPACMDPILDAEKDEAEEDDREADEPMTQIGKGVNEIDNVESEEAASGSGDDVAIMMRVVIVVTRLVQAWMSMVVMAMQSQCVRLPEREKVEDLEAHTLPVSAVSEDSVASLPEEGRPAHRRTTKDNAGSGVDEIKKKKKKEKAATSGKKLKLKRGITMDSGAGDNVMPKRMVRKPWKIRPSVGSRNSMHYVAANNGRIPNEGEYDFEFQTNEGVDEEMTFQIAEVNKALGSISYLVDRNYRVTFDKDMKTGKDISFMLNKGTHQVMRFRRERNIWVLDAIVEVENNEPEGFARQG